MSPQDSSITSSSSSASSDQQQATDSLLAGAGYVVRSSDLGHVAQRLEHLESILVNNPIMSMEITNDIVHYNPSDLASWVDSLLTELHHQQPLLPSDLKEYEYSGSNNIVSGPTTSWADNNNHGPQPHLMITAKEQEDSGIRLVHVLMTCAESVQRGDFSLASSLIDQLHAMLMVMNTDSGIGKVAGYFVDALSRRLFAPPSACFIINGSASDDEALYYHFYEASPCLKFAHFTANQAILEAFQGHDCVHVIDFNLMHGLQWPALIQALALREGGPPMLRLTAIGPPSPGDARESLREIGLRLAELARSVNVKFAFRGVAATRLDGVKPWMLQVSSKEVVAVNSIMQLHKLLGLDPDPVHGSPIVTVLDWIRSLNPKVVTVVEQEADHNQPEFLDRFTEALHYYSTMFDSVAASCSSSLTQPEKALAEMYIQREICNIVCCEGLTRVERHEPLTVWRARLNKAGLKPLHLGSNAFKQASMLLTLFSAEGYCVEENEGCLTLGWHSRPLIAASAWQS